jgi:hypothetical protein
MPQKRQDAFVQHHLPYELWMMRECWAAAKRGATTRFQQNLQVEGFALHARNHIDLLKNGDGCGFNPADFTTAAFSVSRTFIRQTLVDMINEQISHVTSDRTEQQDGKFDVPEWLETANAIENEFQRWIANLKPEWAQKWEQRESMDEAARRELKIESHFGGACTAPTMITGPTGPAPPPDAKR